MPLHSFFESAFKIDICTGSTFNMKKVADILGLSSLHYFGTGSRSDSEFSQNVAISTSDVDLTVFVDPCFEKDHKKIIDHVKASQEVHGITWHERYNDKHKIRKPGMQYGSVKFVDNIGGLEFDITLIFDRRQFEERHWAKRHRENIFGRCLIKMVRDQI